MKAALFPVEVHPGRTSKYPKDADDGLDFRGISFPTPLNQIPYVESLNNIGINVLGYNEETQEFHPLHVTTTKDVPQVNVLFLQKGDKSHYCLIKNLSRLLYSQQDSNGNHYHYCTRCLRGFSAEHVLHKHEENCSAAAGRPTRIEMPEKGKNILKFKNYKHKAPVPWVIYYDFESITEKYATCMPCPKVSTTVTATSKHVPCGFSLLAVRLDGKTKGPYVYQGEDCVQMFLNLLTVVEREIRSELGNIAPINMTKDDWINFYTARKCHICQEELTRCDERDEADVWNPNTGKYVGKAHRYKKLKEYNNYTCFRLQMNDFYTDEKGNHLVMAKNKSDMNSKKLYKDDGNCIECKESLKRSEFRDAVRDHCHITGRYRRAAHKACNLQLRIYPKTVKIPVVAHNCKNYDTHLIMREIGKMQGKLSCIPNNMEKYITFTWGNLRFIDSCQHLNAPLAKLVENGQDALGVWNPHTGEYLGKAHRKTCHEALSERLKHDGSTREYIGGECIECGEKLKKDQGFEITRSYIKGEEKQDLMLRKEVYPYEHMNSFESFNETKLPNRSAFYSMLKVEHITAEDYEHAKRVWKVFEHKDMGDYHGTYLLTDVLLLADVIEVYRQKCYTNYDLDPMHYLTTPGFAWDALLKMTKQELELLTDYDMHLFIEKGMRGVISTFGEKRYAKANNPYMKDYDPEEETSYIMYKDENNEYGWAMCQPLPIGDFNWLKTMSTEKEIMSWQVNRKTGYILEVDLEYPKELHELHNGYSLAPERRVVPHEWYSSYQKKLAEKLGLKEDKTEKLLLTLQNKTKYVLHYRNLQQYLELGLKLKAEG